MLRAAETSLTSGLGPTGGLSVRCLPSGRGVGVQCSIMGLSQTSIEANWTQLCASCGPSERSNVQMAYDEKDGYVILFGGGGTAPNFPYFDDTWIFKAGSWTELHPNVSPPRLFDAAMTYDAVDGYVVMFGGSWVGSNGGGNEVNNWTWKFSGGVWTNITSVPSPPANNGASMAYDAADGYVVMFGGYNPDVITYQKNATLIGGDLGSTWKFSGGRWTNITPAISPEARDSAFMAYDPAEGYVLLFGGINTTYAPLSDTWQFRGGKWTELHLNLSPYGKVGGGIAYDPELGTIVTFGGLVTQVNMTGVYSNETWEFKDGNWSRVISIQFPAARAALGMAFDTTDGYLVLFGGGGIPGHYWGTNDTWVLRPVAIPPPNPHSWWDSPIIAYIASGAVLTLVAIGVVIWRARRKKESMDMHAGSSEDLGNPPQQGVGGTHEQAPPTPPER